MSVRYVDADVLNQLANDSGSARGDVQSVLNQIEGRVNGAPHRGWDEGTWSDVRNTLHSEVGLLDSDRSELISRADRVRIAAVERALMEWIENALGLPGYAASGQAFASGVAQLGSIARFLGITDLASLASWSADRAFDVIGELPTIAMSQIALEEAARGLWALSGDGVSRVISGLGEATTLSPASFFARYGLAQDLADGVGAVATVATTAWQDYGVYEGQGATWRGRFMTATVIDSELSAVAGTVVIAAATGAMITAGWPVLAVVGGVVVVGAAVAIGVSLIQSTPLYKAADKAVVDTIGDAIDPYVRAASSAISDTAGGAFELASNAGKAVDQALNNCVQAVTRPIKNVESFFGSINPMKAFEGS